MRAYVRATRGREGVPRSAVACGGYRGPPRAGKKRENGRQSDARGQKGGKKIFRREQKKARERKKNIGAGAKKRARAKKYSGDNENSTQPTKESIVRRDQ